VVNVKSEISALMDGELHDAEYEAAIGTLERDDEARQAWADYHRVGDALRGVHSLSAGFSERVMSRLAVEPVVLAPPRRRAGALHVRHPVWSIAASVAAAIAVGWVWFALQGGRGDALPVAQAPQPQAGEAVSAEVVLAPAPSGAKDYLLAHEIYSPRGGLQGVATYVRTVSDGNGRLR